MKDISEHTGSMITNTSLRMSIMKLFCRKTAWSGERVLQYKLIHSIVHMTSHSRLPQYNG